MLRVPKLVVISSLLLLSLPAAAGQVRVTLNGTQYTPSTISLNQGDHVVWVWAAGSHTVTSGAGSPDGLFDSGGGSIGIGTLSGAGTAFSWKSTVTGNRDYYCQPHVASGMTGILQIVASGQAVADFRITEVQYAAASGLDRIQITNMGGTTGDLGRYRISISSTAAEQDIVPLPNVSVPVGGRVTIRTNEAGASNATTLFMGGAGGIGDLPSPSGSIALFVPYRTSASIPGPLTSDLVIDYVEWGAAGQANESTAISGGVWPGSEFVSGEPLPAYSISFCGTRNDRGASFWSVSTANFGTSNICATPTTNTSWGRIKTLYR